MAGTMAIGNAGLVNLADQVMVSNTKESNVSFQKIMGDNLKDHDRMFSLGSNTEQLQFAMKGDNLSGASVKDKLETQNTNEKPVQKNDSIKEKCEDVKKQVKEEIKEKLGVTDEELEEKMAELGLTDANLLNPQDVLALCLSLGNAEEMDLLTNDSLYQAITEILDDLNVMTTSIFKNYGMDVNGERSDLVEPMEQESDTDALEDMVNNEDPKDESKIVEGSESEVKASDIPTQTKETTQKVEQKTDQKEGDAHTFLDHTEQTASTEQTVFTETTTSFTTSTTQSVMEQMIESMKMEISPEVTELKMQLHPESLGNVTVQLTAKEGVLTASFTAQNEVVKNALETQMIQLKETLQEKGIQVEAVEVKVDAGAYNEQYQDAKDNESKEAFERELKKNQTRRINLSEYTDTDALGEMSEEEELTVKIMKENGNSLDYSA